MGEGQREEVHAASAGRNKVRVNATRPARLASGQGGMGDRDFAAADGCIGGVKGVAAVQNKGERDKEMSDWSAECNKGPRARLLGRRLCLGRFSRHLDLFCSLSDSVIVFCPAQFDHVLDKARGNGSRDTHAKGEKERLVDGVG